MSATLVPLDVPAPARAWLVDLAHAPSARELEALSADEHERAARFVFDADRRRYLAAHCALRQLLSQHSGVPAHELRFAAGRYGKPHLLGIPGCSFNLSHSHDLALIAMGDRLELGADVEIRRPMKDAVELARRNFSGEEQQELSKAADADLAFLLGWTRKEACLKAIGCGLNVDPRCVETGLGMERRTLGVATPEGEVQVTVESQLVGDRAMVSLAWLGISV